MIRYFSLLCLVGLLVSGFTLMPGKKKFTAPKAFVFVPSGTYSEGKETISMNGFYMMSREATNLDYKEFLFYLKSKGREADYEKARVHPEGWLSVGNHLVAVDSLYFDHPDFEEYPVVNITQEAAQLFCEFLAEAIETNQPGFDVEARLPTEKEWVYAARGGIDGAVYPHGNYLRNNSGHYLYNFRIYGDESIHQDPVSGELIVHPNTAGVQPGDDFFGPIPSKSATPNGYGLRDMSGNVAEMLTEAGRTKGGSFWNTGYDIRIDAPDPYAGFTGSSPYIGFRPVFTVKQK